MTEKKKRYRKLPGRKAGLFDIHTIRMGEDHLLAVYCVFFREIYKRFYYSDIQSVIIRKTVWGAVWNILLGLAATLFLLPALRAENEMMWMYVIFSGLIWFLFLINCIMGPTCICHIRTPAQTEKLPSLHRLRTARRVMSRILPFIEKAQGQLTPEILEKRPMPPAEMRKTPSEIRKQKAVSPKFHRILFALLLTCGFLNIGDMFSDYIIFTLLSYLISMTFFILLIIALVRQHGSDLEGKVKICTWSVLGFIIAENALGLALYFFLIFQQSGLAVNQWEMLRAMALLQPFETPWIAGIYLFSICGSLLLGGMGLFLLRGGKEESEPAGPEFFLTEEQK